MDVYCVYSLVKSLMWQMMSGKSVRPVSIGKQSEGKLSDKTHWVYYGSSNGVSLEAYTVRRWRRLKTRFWGRSLTHTFSTSLFIPLSMPQQVVLGGSYCSSKGCREGGKTKAVKLEGVPSGIWETLSLSSRFLEKERERKVLPSNNKSVTADAGCLHDWTALTLSPVRLDKVQGESREQSCEWHSKHDDPPNPKMCAMSGMRAGECGVGNNRKKE